LILIINMSANAQWSTDPAVNNVVCSYSGDQTNVQMVSDGNGGAIATWQDYRATSYDIYAQHISSTGALLWNVDGVAICTAILDQIEPRIVSDGFGGAIITWKDNRNSNDGDVYAQKINSNGEVLWTIEGTPICTTTGYQGMQQLTTDNNGGAIITWSDGRNGSPNADIYAQSINSGGTVQWAVNGVAICTAAYNQGSPQIVSDGNSGAIITWDDVRGSWADIYAQRINSSGIVSWLTDGVQICVANYHQDHPRIVPDAGGGAVICWQDNRNNNSIDIYAQKINSSGIVQWVANGVGICNAPYLQCFIQMVANGSGGAYITWEDRRSYSDIYAQQISTDGILQWTVDGLPICTSNPVQKDPQLCLNSLGNLTIVWTENYKDIFAQSVTPSGNLLWSTDGLPICNNTASKSLPQIISSTSGHVIIAWQDTRDGTYDIYAQSISNNGVLAINSSNFQSNAPLFLFPNPGNGIFTLKLNSEQVNQSSVRVFNLLGAEVLFKEIISENTMLDITQQPKGVYLVSIQTPQGKLSKKLILK